MADLRGDPDQPTADPFADAGTVPTQTVIPTEDINPPSTQPATPAQPKQIDAPPLRRVVHVIRGGTDSQIVFTVPAPRAITAETDSSSSIPDGEDGK